jgi:hypothetical protein
LIEVYDAVVLISVGFSFALLLLCFWFGAEAMADVFAAFCKPYHG